MIRAHGQRLLHDRMEEFVEAIHRLGPFHRALRNGVKLLLHVGREVVIDHLGEGLGEEVVDHRAHVRRQQLVAVGAHRFSFHLLRNLPVHERQHAELPLLARLIATHHILAVLDRLNRRCIRRWAADAKLLHAVHQPGLGVSRRPLREALRGDDLASREAVANLHRGQQLRLLLRRIGLVVRALAIDAQEAVELDHLAHGHELVRESSDANRNRRALQFGVGHLAGQGAFIDQVVQLHLLCAGTDRWRLHVGGANSLVCLLRTLALGVVVAQVVVTFAILLGDGLARGRERHVAEVKRVGTHVGDEPRFIQSLSHHHGLRHGESQLAGRLLLQRRGGEGRRGRLLHRALCGVFDRERCLGILTRTKEGFGLVAILQLTVQFGLEQRLSVGQQERGHNAKRRLGHEPRNLALPLHDQSHSHRLHTSGRQRRLDLAPQHRRKLEAHNAVEHTPCLLGIDKVDVDASRRVERMQDGRLRDLVKDDALRAVGRQFERLAEVPRNGLSLAVLIGCEQHLTRILRRLLQLRH